MCIKFNLFVIFSQLTAVGPTGASGDGAQCPVDQEYSIGIGLVPIPRRRTVERSVLGKVDKVIPAIENLARVIDTTYIFSYLHVVNNLGWVMLF